MIYSLTLNLDGNTLNFEGSELEINLLWNFLFVNYFKESFKNKGKPDAVLNMLQNFSLSTIIKSHNGFMVRQKKNQNEINVNLLGN